MFDIPILITAVAIAGVGASFVIVGRNRRRRRDTGTDQETAIISERRATVSLLEAIGWLTVTAGGAALAAFLLSR